MPSPRPAPLRLSASKHRSGILPSSFAWALLRLPSRLKILRVLFPAMMCIASHTTAKHLPASVVRRRQPAQHRASQPKRRPPQPSTQPPPSPPLPPPRAAAATQPTHQRHHPSQPPQPLPQPPPLSDELGGANTSCPPSSGAPPSCPSYPLANSC